ncbi:MAG: ABC transporter ATP-binding protein [Candidatus Saccharibacteria bacterium]
MIEVKNLTKIYGKSENSFKALDKINIIILDKATVAIVGKSGSGKSTLMHIMSGLDAPSSGTVIVDGTDIFKMSEKKIDSFRATQMSFVFQSFFIEANATCLQNVLLPLEIARVPMGKRKKMALDALDAVELGEKANLKASTLSGGQKQRLAVARAIVNKPAILFADEPTGNLDSITGDKIMKLLFNLNKKIGCTIILVTHDEDLAKHTSMRIKVKDGKIEAIEGGNK